MSVVIVFTLIDISYQNWNQFFLFKEYTWRRKTTEGSSLVCQICGHLAYKLFTQVVESSFDDERHRRQFNNSVQVWIFFLLNYEFVKWWIFQCWIHDQNLLLPPKWYTILCWKVHFKNFNPVLHPFHTTFFNVGFSVSRVGIRFQRVVIQSENVHEFLYNLNFFYW